MSDQVGSIYTPAAEAFFTRVRELLPSFAAVDDDGREDWTDDDGSTLGYVRIAILAGHLIEIAGPGRSAVLRPVFEVVEAGLESADPYTKDLLVVGLLEDLQNAVLRTDGQVTLLDVRALLGSSSTEAWDDLIRFWHGTDARERLPPGSLPEDA